MIPLRLGAATNDLSGLLQKGLFEEEANRNLDAAVQAYQLLVTAFDRDRKLAATAVFRLGECYRKLGKTNEAVLQYERIVREFADEATLATLSRQNLAGLGSRNKASVSSTLTQTAREEQKRLLEQEIELLEQDLAEAKKRFEMGASPQSDMRNKEREILQLQRQVAALDANSDDHPAGAGGDGSWSVDRARRELSDAEKEFVQLKEFRNKSPEYLPHYLASKDDELKYLLRLCGDKERELAALKESYTVEHPEVKTAEAELKALTRQIDDRIAGILQGYEIRRQTLREYLVSLEKEATSKSQNTNASLTALPTDPEETEIRRLQAMVKDSPDLLNAAGEGGLTPLCRAANAGWLRAAKLLLDQGASMDRRAGASGWTAMHFAADSGHKAMVELLAGRGAEVNAQNNNGETALHLAAAKGHLSLAEALIQRKADVNARSRTENEGVTPLQRAAAQGHQEMVAFLISRNAEVGARNASGMTALSCAALKGHAEVVKALLAAKADPNERGSSSPLFCALHQPECLELLLEAGANPNVKDRSGQTPLLKTIEGTGSRMPFGGSGQREDSKPLPPGPVPAAGTGTNLTSRIHVSGEVRSPGALTVQPGEKITVAKAIVRAGDCTDFANKKKVKVVRAGRGDGGKKQEFEVNLTDILEHGKTEQDIVLEAGDMVIVPRKVF